MCAVKAVSDIVDHTGKAGVHDYKAPSQPGEDFGGGKRSPGGGLLGTGGPLPPILLGAAALVSSRHIANHRCGHCGKFTVVTATTPLPSEIDWVDTAELALADLMDDEGRVSRSAASAAITRLAPATVSSRGRATSLVGTGMIEQVSTQAIPTTSRLPAVFLRDCLWLQLFMLEVEEPSHEFELDDSDTQTSLRGARPAMSAESREYKREIRGASSLRGTADFTSLVTLLRQSVTAGCFTDEIHETTYVCSSCGVSAYEPLQQQKESAGFKWDGGHAVVVPRDRHGNDGDRVRVYLLCQRSGAKRFHGFHHRDDSRNTGGLVEGGDGMSML